MIDPSYYEVLRSEVCALAGLGLQLQTVIPLALPAELYPKRQRNKDTGRWEPVLKNGQPVPAFVGKNPSCWRSDGRPRTISHAMRAGREELLARIAVAEQLGKELGLAIIPSTDVVSIDFDTKNYASVQDLEADWMALLDRYPLLTGTRMERTPSGGVHIYVRVADAMASWQRPGGGLYCNFSTEQGGPHRGEVLAGTRVSVCAPTQNGSGPYELINHEAAHHFVEVADLESIGIFPVVRNEPAVPPAASATAVPAAQIAAPNSPAAKVPRLIELIGDKAKALLNGDRPYGTGEAAAGDRSLQLTGFAKELYSWINLLQQQGLRFEGDADQLLQQAIAALGIEDKAERVLSSIDPGGCCHADPERAVRHYQWLAGDRTRRWGRRGDTQRVSMSSSTEAGPADPSRPPLLSREAVSYTHLRAHET